MGFSAVNLRGALEFGQALPCVPDFRYITGRLEGIMGEVSELEGGTDVVEEIEYLRRDVDCDDSLLDYVDTSQQVIQDMHDKINRLYCMIKEKDFYNMNRTDMLSLLDGIERGLDYARPDGLFIREITHQLPSYFDYQTFKIMNQLVFLDRVLMECTEKDIYAGEYIPREDIFNEWGRMEIEIYPNKIFFYIPFTDSSMVIKYDGKISLSTDSPNSGKNVAGMIETEDLKEYFFDWLRPTEEEIALFDTIRPGLDFTVIRYIKECLGNTCVQNNP